MLEISGLAGLKKIKWQELAPGMIFVGGVVINNAVPPELRDFPVITQSFLEDLREKYRFLHGREILVAVHSAAGTPGRVSAAIREQGKRLAKVNRFRDQFFEEKRKILGKLGLDPNLDIPLLEGDFTERTVLGKDTYNSFTIPFFPGTAASAVPSFLRHSGLKLTLGDLLTGRLKKKFNLPDDSEVLLHLVVDYSHSMNERGKLDIVLSALNYFCAVIAEFLLNTKIQIYVFSDECRPVNYPLGGKEIPRKETNYASFIKKVLHHKNTDVRNAVILFSDGQPSDYPEALKLSALFVKNKIDYTQILFSMSGDLRHQVELSPERAKTLKTVDGRVDGASDDEIRILSDEELREEKRQIFERFTGLAEAGHGNQVCLKVDEIAHLVSVECYDRYLGLLTLATRQETKHVMEGTYKDARQGNDLKAGEQKGPRIKKWTFPKIKK